MQKHSDRKEPRPPIIQMGATNGSAGGQGGGGQTNVNNTGGGSSGGNSLAALGSAASTTSVSQSVVESYWPKVDPASAVAYAAHAAHHDRSGEYLGMADPRLHPHAAHQVIYLY